MARTVATVNEGARLTIVMGLPGVGKTTFATELAARYGGVRLCPDEWMDSLDIDLWDSDARQRIEDLQWQFAKQLIALGNHAIIEWGTWARVERDTLRLGARALGATVVLHYLEAPLDVLYERISARGRENPPITRDDIESWAAIIELPTPEELALFDAPDYGATE